MLSSTMTVLEENEESLISDLALIKDRSLGSLWVQSEMAQCIVNTDITVVNADVSFFTLDVSTLNEKLLIISCIKGIYKHY